MPERLRIDLTGDTQVTALAYPAREDTARGATLVLGHGAGADQTSRFMVSFAQGFADRGIETVTFNFPYMERRRRLPDPSARLEACYGAVIASVQSRPGRAGSLFIGGKSLGGRIASQVAARDDLAASLAGLVFLGYPLHPPRKPQQLRSAHLPRIRVPMLFVQGSHDSFGTPDELRSILATVPSAVLYVVDGGDHSLAVRRRSGPSMEQLHATIQDDMASWITNQSTARQALASPQSPVLS